jgi:hypothetical protein
MGKETRWEEFASACSVQPVERVPARTSSAASVAFVNASESCGRSRSEALLGAVKCKRGVDLSYFSLPEDREVVGHWFVSVKSFCFCELARCLRLTVAANRWRRLQKANI